jgi:hypothetical protein
LTDTELEGWSEETETSLIAASKSTALPKSTDEKVYEDSAESGLAKSSKVIQKSPDIRQPSSPTPHERWSTLTSDDVPLLADTETSNNEEEVQPTETAAQETGKKPLIKAEYKIAFSHFLVRI